MNLTHILKNKPDEDNNDLYELYDIDNPDGWNFSEINLLYEMGFTIESRHHMMCELEVPSVYEENEDEKHELKVYKSSEGYILEAGRKYVFEDFQQFINFIDNQQ